MAAHRLVLALYVLSFAASVYAEDGRTPVEVDVDAKAVQGIHELSCEAAADCVGVGFKSAACRHGVCVEDSLFPLSDTEIYGSIAAFLSNILAAGSGLGGGGLLVPLYILTMGLTSHDAIPLSKATIFGSAIASFILNVRKRHPLARDRPLIDYETVLLMEPMTLAGTIIGVNMNAVFPEWLITICIVWLLTKTAQRTLVKGKKIWAEETAADNKILSDIVAYWKLLPYESKFKQFQAVARAYIKWKSYKRSDKLVMKLEPSNPQDDDRMSLASTVLSINDTDEDDGSDANEEETLMNAGVKKTDLLTDHMPSLEELKEYRRRVPFVDVFVLFLTWIGLVLFSLAKGGHGTASIVGIQCGSVSYWSLVAMSFPFFAIVTLYYAVKIARVHRFLQASGYEYLKGDMVWTKSATFKYPALCTAAGLAAGLLGIGGGMVKGPLLLEMGLLPQVSSATSSSMILFTSSATTIQFIILGTLSVEHALWHGMVGFFAGLIGQIGLSYLIKKYRKTAFVIFLVAGVVGSSGIIMGILGARKVLRDGMGNFRPLCG
ncbi:hypothetical protein Poli38472_000564 [Pythium oligandrum]|uniref:Sulfite exporter TauE/SafE family protein n=1 Tax=Pythium oligandrum TaxID=41045 RepID=A0A8K1CE03_PYTOL|nr:hypothetical protein Poli38472_000564 [Pythium oligandrum]|eukprot:TMW60522.1 hypothetical protein Poli38472_000564 [Pythium oligandrum]